MIKPYWISALCLLGLVGCSGLPNQSPLSSSITASISLSTNSLRTETPQPLERTSIPIPEFSETSTELFMPSITSTPTPNIPLVPVEILSAPPKNISLEGFLALLDFSKEIGSEYYLVDLTSGSVTQLDLKSGSTVSLCGPVSPNQERLVCDSKGRLLILDNQGELLTSLPWKQNWGLLLGWLDNDRLLIQKKEPPLAATIIYDPFKNVEVEIPPDYPNISNLEPLNNIGNFSATAAFYNPTLENVVYESLNNTDVVWDRTLKQVIGEIPIGGTINPYPQWSPDGQQVVIAGKRNRPDLPDTEETGALDIYLVTGSGEIRQATNLSTHFSNPKTFNLSWSPDGRLIAFLLDTDDPACMSRCIMILDPQTLSLRGYQLPEGYFVNAADYPVYRLTWSPDSRQLLLSVSKYSDPDKTFLIVLDISNNKAFQIAKDSRILGWMSSNP
jgi:hypothetical protein